MKASFLSLIFIIVSQFCFAQTEIKLEDVTKHVGESVTVCGKVFGGKYLSNSKGSPTFLNLGESYPNQPLTIVIWGDHRSLFTSAPELLFDKKEICVKGKIELYKGKPQIVVKEANQISNKE